MQPSPQPQLSCSADPAYSAAHEAEQALFRPLFTTSFLIDDFLADNAFFGARNVILSSASSKTAYGTAFCLAQRAGAMRVYRDDGSEWWRLLSRMDEFIERKDLRKVTREL